MKNARTMPNLGFANSLVFRGDFRESLALSKMSSSSRRLIDACAGRSQDLNWDIDSGGAEEQDFDTELPLHGL